jgi:hypothetical protein
MKVYDEKMKLYLVLADNDQKVKYQNVIDQYPIEDVIISGIGANVARNASIDYFPDGEPVIFLDDDISKMRMLKHSKMPLETQEYSFVEVFDYVFNKLQEHNLSAFNVNGRSNLMFKQNSPFLEIRPNPIWGMFYGMFNDKHSKVDVGHGDDIATTSYFLNKDRRIATLNWLFADANYGTLKGGMQSSGCRDDIANRVAYTLGLSETLLASENVSRFYSGLSFDKKANWYSLKMKSKKELDKILCVDKITYSTYLQEVSDQTLAAQSTQHLEDFF